MPATHTGQKTHRNAGELTCTCRSSSQVHLETADVPTRINQSINQSINQPDGTHGLDAVVVRLINRGDRATFQNEEGEQKEKRPAGATALISRCAQADAGSMGSPASLRYGTPAWV